jgi:hypothetical protein
MHSPSDQVEKLTISASSSITTTRLHGARLTVAWGAWSFLTLLCLINFVTSVTLYIGIAKTLCHPGSCMPGQPTSATTEILRQFGVSVSTYTTLSVGLVVFSGIVYCAVAAVIVWRKPTDWMALLTASMLITQGLFENNYLQGALSSPSSPWYGASLLLTYLSPIQLLFFAALFPTGRWAARWLGRVLIGLSLIDILPNFFPSMPFAGLEALFVLTAFPLVVGSMVYRYRRLSTPVERQQTKWVVFGLSLEIFVFLVWLVPQVILFQGLSPAGSVYDLIGHPLLTVSEMLVPICIGIAILRYRLWDIDAIISLALVYGLLSALLAVVYAGLIVGLGSLASIITGPADNAVVLVIATLVTAALILPVRRRIQAVIDRRFYRRKYDAQKTLEAFSTNLRQEVDLTQLREQLLSVVDETMQPAHVSLWLRDAEREPWDLSH